MKYWLGAFALLCACSYDPPVEQGDGSDDPADPSDPTDPPQPLLGECFAANDPLLCLEFERPDSMKDDLALDGSGHGFHAVRDDMIDAYRLLVPAVNDDDALAFGPNGSLTIDRELGLAGSVTVEMWALTSSRPQFFESSSRVALSRNNEGQLQCTLNGNDDLSVDGGNLDGGWHHIACTFDSASKTLKVWVDGSVKDCKKLQSGIDTSRSSATSLNAGLAGGLDRVHAYLRELSPSELCSQAGRSSCNSTCPVENGGGQGPNFPGPGGS